MQGRRADHQLRPRRADRRRRTSRTRSTPARSPAPRSTSSRPSRSPSTRCSRYPNVVVTPHLGASTTEAQDRAGVQTAEQVVAALTGGVVSTAVNIPADLSAEDMEVLGPFLPLCAAARPARHRAGRAVASSASRSSTSAGSPSATRACSRSPCSTACSPAAPRRRSTSSTRRSLAEERGIDGRRDARAARARLRRPRPRHVVSGGERGARRRHDARPAHRPHLLEAWGQRFNLQIDDAPRAVPLLRRARHGRPRRHPARRRRHQHRPDGGRPQPERRRRAFAVMVLTTDAAVPPELDQQRQASTASSPAAPSHSPRPVGHAWRGCNCSVSGSGSDRGRGPACHRWCARVGIGERVFRVFRHPLAGGGRSRSRGGMCNCSVSGSGSDRGRGPVRPAPSVRVGIGERVFRVFRHPLAGGAA